MTFFTFPATSTLAFLTGDGGARRLRQCRCHQRPLHRGIRSGTRRVRLSRCHTCEPAERHCPRRKTRPAPRIQRSMRQKVRPAHVLLSTTGFFVSRTFFPSNPHTPHKTNYLVLRYQSRFPCTRPLLACDTPRHRGLVWFCGPGVVRVVGCYWLCCAHWRAYWLGESQPSALWGCSSF